MRVYLQDAPQKIATDGKLIALYSILRHEHKLGVVTLSILPNSEVDLASEPLKSKDPLILQYGHRRMVINPLYSQGTPGTAMNNVYKFEKYLQPARASYATIIAPLMFGAVPALFYRQAQDGGVGELIATGTLCPAQPEPPIITKRIVLTGHPFKIHKRTVTVRFMFFNKEDINWFKPIRLVTSRGRSGFISESLGTHGWFKARFDGTVMQNEAVGMSLYKRMWPREASEFQC